MSDAIFRIVVLNSAAALLLSGFALVCAWARVRPGVVAVCWLAALVKLVVPPLVPVPVEWGMWRVHEFFGAWGAPLRPVVPTVVSIELKPGAGGDVDGGEPDFRTTATVDPSPRADVRSHVAFRTVVFVLWGAGACLWAGLALSRMRRFHRVVSGGEVVAFGRPKTVMVEAAVPPVLWAFGGRARIVVPRGLWSELTEMERAAVLAHERAHFRRRDHWVRWIECVVLCVCWWHPLVWWISRRLHEAEEAACDRLVVRETSEPRVYAAALIRAALFLDSCGRLPRAATGIRSVSSLTQRIDSIMKPVDSRKLTMGGLFALLSVLTFSVLADPLAAPAEASPSIAGGPVGVRPETEAPKPEPSAEPPSTQDPLAPAEQRPGKDPEIEGLYLSGYIKTNEAQKLRTAGDIDAAKRILAEALSIFESIQSRAPDWQPKMVEYRMDRTRKMMAELTTSAGAKNDMTILTPLSSSSAGLKRVGLKVGVLGRTLVLAADRIDLMEPATVPGRSRQVTFWNGESSYSADVDSPSPGSSLIITGAIHANWAGWNILADDVVVQEAQLLITGNPLVAVEAGSETPKWILKARRLSVDLKTHRVRVSGGEDLLNDTWVSSDPGAGMEMDFNLEDLPKPFPKMSGNLGRRQLLNLSSTGLVRERDRLLLGWPSRSEWSAEMDSLVLPRRDDLLAPESGITDQLPDPDAESPTKVPPR